MEKNPRTSDRAQIFLEFAHKAVVAEAEKLSALAELLQIPSDAKIDQYVDAIRDAKRLLLTNSLEYKGDVQKEMIDAGVQTEDVFECLTEEARHEPSSIGSSIGIDFEDLSVCPIAGCGYSNAENFSNEAEGTTHSIYKIIEDKAVVRIIPIEIEHLPELFKGYVSTHTAINIETVSESEGFESKSVIDSEIAEETKLDTENVCADGAKETVEDSGTETLRSEKHDDSGTEIQNNYLSIFIKSTLDTLDEIDTKVDQSDNLQNYVDESSSNEPHFTQTKDDGAVTKVFDASQNAEVNKLEATKQGALEHENKNEKIPVAYIRKRQEAILEEVLKTAETLPEQTRSKESEAMNPNRSILDFVKPKGYQSSPREEVTVKGDKDDVLRCLSIAQTAIAEDNLSKAERFLLKSERIYPTEAAKKLLAHIHIAKEEKTNKKVENKTNIKVQQNEKARKLLREARKAFSEKKYDKAEVLASKSYKLNPRGTTRDFLFIIEDAKLKHGT